MNKISNYLEGFSDCGEIKENRFTFITSIQDENGKWITRDGESITFKTIEEFIIFFRQKKKIKPYQAHSCYMRRGKRFISLWFVFLERNNKIIAEEVGYFDNDMSFPPKDISEISKI